MIKIAKTHRKPRQSNFIYFQVSHGYRIYSIKRRPRISAALESKNINKRRPRLDAAPMMWRFNIRIIYPKSEYSNNLVSASLKPYSP